MRRMARWIALVAAGELLLLWLGSGALAAPHLREPGSWPGWLVARSTDVAVLALVRLGALWAGAYLLGVLAFGTVTRALRWRPLIRLGDVVTPPALRRVLDRAMGVAAASSLVVAAFTGSTRPVAAATAADSPERPSPVPAGPPITLRGLAGPRPDRAPTTTSTIPMPPTATPSVEDVAPPPPATVPVPPAPVPSPAAAPPVAPEQASAPSPAPVPLPAPPTAADTWTVRRGDSFWVIAHRVLADAWGRAPSARETDPYWRALVEANRSRLADADNPDLLFAGQVLAVPPPPARAA